MQEWERNQLKVTSEEYFQLYYTLKKKTGIGEMIPDKLREERTGGTDRRHISNSIYQHIIKTNPVKDICKTLLIK